jgi:4-hydroxybenzoate polyprenyltransferase
MSVREYAKLIRPYGILFLGLTPVFGALCNEMFDMVHLLFLLLIGVLVHIFTFVQNDIFDVDVDTQSTHVSKRPLVAGNITKNNALIIVLLSLVFSLLSTVFVFFSLVSFCVLVLVFFLMTLYNKCSKRFAGMEYVLGLGVFSLGVFGALTVSDTASLFAVIVSLACGMQWLFSVGVSANLKDVKEDAQLGIRTTPSILGVRAENERLVISISFWVYALLLKFLHIMILSTPFFLGYVSIYAYDLLLSGVPFIVLSFVLMYTTVMILSTPLSKRDTMLRYQGLHEGFALLLIPVMLLSYLVENLSVMSTMLLLVIIILWPLIMLRMLFGKTMIPLE